MYNTRYSARKKYIFQNKQINQMEKEEKDNKKNTHYHHKPVSCFLFIWFWFYSPFLKWMFLPAKQMQMMFSKLFLKD